MVSTAVNGSTPASDAPEGLPPGNYTIVGWDIDTTGRRLIDDICQIAGYTAKSQFSQYIMPHSNMNPGARCRHNIRIVTIGRYRMLKDNVTNKVLKTKSEISALTEFLDWLASQKESSSDGIILIYHESRRIASPMLLEAMQRYNLLDRFKSLVIGFADGQALAADKCRASVKSFGLRIMANVLLDLKVELERAAERASAAYQVAHHLSQGEQQELSTGKDDAASYKNMVEVVRAYTRSTEKELSELSKLKSLLSRQNTFRPVFAPLFSSLVTSRDDRMRASTLRRLLVEADFDYQKLQEVWNNDHVDGLKTELACLSSKANEEQLKELIEILDCHFDPEKQSKGFKPKAARINKNGVQNKNANSDGGNIPAETINSGTTSPDTVSSGSPVKAESEKGAMKPASANGRSQVTAAN